MSTPRVVLDTNVWLDWLVFDDPAVAALREACESDRVQVVIDDACEAELVRVLTYDLGAYSLDPAEQARRVARCRAIAMRISAPAHARLPKCRDPDDQKFLELAAASGARVVVSKDLALLELSGRLPGVRIVTPSGFDALA